MNPKHHRQWRAAIRAVLGMIVLAWIPAFAAGDTIFREAVEADWARQEARMGREAGDSASVEAALRRAERLLGNLVALNPPPDLRKERGTLDSLKQVAFSLPGMDLAARIELYNRIRWTAREAAMKNPLLKSDGVIFMKRRRFICQMLHEYLGYFYDYGDVEGGGVYRLADPGRSFEVRDLLADPLPRGNFTTLSLSYDAKTAYFAFAERSETKPDYYSPERKGFHIFALDLRTGSLRQLTDGPYDDFDPCELPDGGIAFMSTRRGGFGRCHNPWEPLPTYTLHRMNPDGTGIQTLSFHETNEWHPSALNDGRIAYTRWDYVDRSAANYHGIWAANPDGSNPVHLFGNYTRRVNACYHPRAIPGSNKIAFIAGAHHADVGGSLVVFDPDRARLHPETGEDELDSLEVLTPEVCFPEAPGWPDSYFHSPWPLSGDYFLVSFSFDPLPGMGPKVEEDTKTGLYLFDRFGGMELLYRDDDYSCMYPIPIKPRPRPPAIPSALDAGMGNEGEFLLTDVRRGRFPLPENRPVRSLHIFQILPKSETHVANQPRLGYANAESARMLLGSVPVEEDGSAYFRAPAGKPLVFQAVDGEGRAVRGMRSLTYLQPGERRGCVGCHEPYGETTPAAEAMAFSRPPSRIEPGPEGSMPWSYPLLVQPILDRNCIRCHDGGAGAFPPELTSRPDPPFTVSHNQLKPYVRWFEWGEQSIDQVITRPGRMPSDVSPLVAAIQDATHAAEIRLTENDKRALYLWLDGNASFHGVYSEAERLAQIEGRSIPPPALQ